VRSDIYSLGETLWFALTGKTPFAGRTVEEIHRAQQSSALPIEQLKAARVPHGLRWLLTSMLAFEPASRPGTGELAARLRRCSPEVRRARRTGVAFAAAALVLLGMSALFVFQSSRIQNAVLNPPPEKSIAVLPFENRSDDKANAYFADGIQDEILTRFSNIADLKVISRTSTRQYQSKPGNLREIAKQLGVANILEGSVQKMADQVRVNAQLISVQSDSHLWADTYDRKLTDIFGVESDIAKRIAESSQAKLTGREEQALAVKPTNNPEAYDAYLRALVVFLALGFVFSAILSWIFDITPEGIKRTADISPDEAVDIVRQLQAQARQEFIRGYLSALLYAGLGDKTKAIDYVKHGYLNHEDFKHNNIDPSGMSVDAMLDQLRGDPRFEALAEKPQ
jgi:TolB-like protein